MMLITEMEVRITLFETSAALTASTYARTCMRHMLSVEVRPVPTQQSLAEKCPSHLRAGLKHRGHATLPGFRQPKKPRR